MMTVGTLARPEPWAIVFSGALTLAWITMCGFWAWLAKDSVKRQSSMLSEYGHLIQYVEGTNQIVNKSINGLATYDRDEAIELAHELDALATKSLYDSYWRQSREESSDSTRIE